MRTRSVAYMFTGTCVLAWTAAGFSGVQASQPPVTPGTGRGGAAAAVEPCGGRSARPQVPCAGDVARMVEVLPVKAPAMPKRGDR